MAHWAEIDKENVVVRVVVGSNDDADEGYGWIVENLGGTWLKNSYNGNIRGRFAGVGYTYDEELDEFIPPSPFPSWVWDGSGEWVPPIPPPTTTPPGVSGYNWDEEAGEWVAVPEDAVE